MARNNSSLKTAQAVKNDEFYTQISDIEQEIGNYYNHFKDKIIYMPCDNPEWSNFWHVLKEQYIYLHYKKIIATFYNGVVDVDKQPYKLEYDGVNETKTFLEGNGDFRSEECTNILQESDIVITNPPFSLFREFVKWIIDADKEFLIIGNQNAITYKEIFPYLKENKMWLGTGSNLSIIYKTPYKNTQASNRDRVIKNGINPDDGYILVAGICWFTNLDIKKRHDTLETGCLYGDDPSKYPTYDNYNAINCDKTNEIPDDYDGLIGVPITFLNKYCPAQFEIIDGIGRYSILDNEATKKEGKYLSMINGEAKYFRLIIKRKPNNITYLSGAHLITHRFKSPTEAYDTE